MTTKTKRIKAMEGAYDREALFAPAEALEMVKKLATAKFDESVEIAMRLGVDPRKADQMLRGTIVLPSGSGRIAKVAVFAAAEAAEAARQAGADFVGADDLVNKVQNENFSDFDVAIATPDLMVQVGKLGKILGPKGLMPNPKTGTVTTDVGKAVREFKSGRVEYRTDRVGNVHVILGKVSFATPALLENFRAVIDEISRVKPASAKGRYYRSVTLCSSMGPGVKIDTNKLRLTDDDINGLDLSA
jgi:large subunit ribosomal protein L1